MKMTSWLKKGLPEKLTPEKNNADKRFFTTHEKSNPNEIAAGSRNFGLIFIFAMIDFTELIFLSFEVFQTS